ncbi:hypothetical protein BDW02DRAFT_569567 [Decorospora gaudefroyi]|uniref:F-box domain-containing protein n=1 Tax=Decorospora gaudefroyi TaxID=184978 RepID=A0A6A5KEP7_9PLEO|nr:hypothetical protein BDW02DRAFT_569567 [Decorospora gaudefroyi]
MSAAAGAPPPPPPPPPPPGPRNNDNCFDGLPAELLLIIYRFTGLGNFLNLALAIYPTLQQHNLAPELTTTTLVRVFRESNTFPITTTPSIAQVPVELWLQVAQYLEPADDISLILALAPWFRREMTRATRDRLRIWSRRCRKK